MLVFLIYATQLVAATLVPVHRKQIKSEFFPSELQRNYQGDTSSEVFSASWNTLVIVLTRCSVLGPEDFGNSSRFHELHPASHGPAAPRTGLSWCVTCWIGSTVNRGALITSIPRSLVTGS
ncbi:unnamed protein product [Lepidochelys kempii]